MKKFCYSLAAAALAPAIIISVANSALAQRRNTTSHDVPTAQALERSDEASVRDQTNNKMMKHDKHNRSGCDCAGPKDCAKHCGKKMHDDRKDKKHHDLMREERAELEENYNEALAKIQASKLSGPQKDLLVKHANENKDLMLRQLDERQQLMQAHIRQYKNDDFPMDNKADRKAVKKVRKILTD